MKIGLIFPNKDRKDRTVHLGLGYIASYARTIHKDVEFKILDTRTATKKETRNFFEIHFDLIGLTVLSPVYFEVIDLVKYIRKINPLIPICLGGPYVTTIMQEIFIETPADFAVYGEGELTFAELISHLKSEVSIENIKGLMYKGSDEKIITNAPREQIKNLDELPMPAYDLFHMNRYPMHRIVTSRGCPYTCVFCNSSSIWLGKWRKRSAQSIVSEIEFLLKNYKRKSFLFSENTFNADMKRVEIFCKLLIEKKIKIMWSTPVRPDLITPALAKLMKESGCYNVGIGIESANNRILDMMEKKTSIEAIQKGITIFKNAGIEVLGQFVIGSPGDTLETVKESIEFAKKSELDFVMFYSILPFKDTKQWEYIEREGKFFSTTGHHFHNTKPRIVFETPEFSYADRLTAINLATSMGYYSDSNDKSSFFDFGRDVAKAIQQYLPQKISDSLYIRMKNFYRRHLRKT